MKISYLNGICVKHDAISNSIVQEIALLKQAGHDVRLYVHGCDYAQLDGVSVEVVQELAQVAVSQHFLDSELVVLHFGIFYPLFNLLPLVPRSAKSLVVFHNVTPAELVPAASREVVQRSFEQMYNIGWANHVLCVSEVNLQVLRNAGIRTPATVMPLAVTGLGAPPERKPSFKDHVVRGLYLGRFVHAKGVLELLEALRQLLPDISNLRFQFDFLGNLGFSDPEVVEKMRSGIDHLNERFGDQVTLTLLGGIDDAGKEALLDAADIYVQPSHHEGFCVPVLEAIARGCRIITYDNSNLPTVAGGLGALVRTGDVDGLRQTLASEISRVRSSDWRKSGYHEYTKAARAHCADFSLDNFARRFQALVWDVTEEQQA